MGAVSLIEPVRSVRKLSGSPYAQSEAHSRLLCLTLQGPLSATAQHRPLPTSQCTDQAFGGNKKIKTRTLAEAGETAVRLRGELPQVRLRGASSLSLRGQPAERPFSPGRSKGAGSLDALGLARELVGPGGEGQSP